MPESTLVKMSNCWKSHELAQKIHHKETTLVDSKSINFDGSTMDSHTQRDRYLVFSPSAPAHDISWADPESLSDWLQTASEYDQEIPQSHDADQPTAP